MNTRARLPDPAFWRGRRVLLTGHTGFKGSWAALWLSRLRAQVNGMALPPATDPNLYGLANVGAVVSSHIADMRDPRAIAAVVAAAKPELVLHLAAQSLVRAGYASPVETFAVNALGTANLLEALRDRPELRAVLVVTTDKVYENAESGSAFRETDPLGGHDPYSASKAAAEIVTRSFARSFFADVPVLTARGGNVIGGGDFADDRLVPDVWRAARAGRPVVLRYPNAIRPWQHVLDCLNGYLLFLEDAAMGKPVPHALNFGPDKDSADLRVHGVVERLQRHLGRPAGWIQEEGAIPREMQALTLSPALSKSTLGWRALLDADGAIAWTADWYGALGRNAGMAAMTASQIEAFTEMA